MSKRRHPKPRRPTQPTNARLFGMVRLPNETLWFVLVSVLDYLMTYLVVYYSHLEESPLQHKLVESNPVAAYFINHWGLEKGLLGFKLSIVAAICLFTQRIALHQARVARWVLNFGTIATAAVVLYSLSLLLRASH